MCFEPAVSAFFTGSKIQDRTSLPCVSRFPAGPLVRQRRFAPLQILAGARCIGKARHVQEESCIKPCVTRRRACIPPQKSARPAGRSARQSQKSSADHQAMTRWDQTPKLIQAVGLGLFMYLFSASSKAALLVMSCSRTYLLNSSNKSGSIRTAKTLCSLFFSFPGPSSGCGNSSRLLGNRIRRFPSSDPSSFTSLFIKFLCSADIKSSGP